MLTCIVQTKFYTNDRKYVREHWRPCDTVEQAEGFIAREKARPYPEITLKVFRVWPLNANTTVVLTHEYSEADRSPQSVRASRQKHFEGNS